MASRSFARLIFSKTSENLVRNSWTAQNVRLFSSPATGNFEFIKISTAGAKNNVGIITLNRPKVLNALCVGLLKDVSKALDSFEADNSIGAIIITGSEKAFAAGADIKEIQNDTYAQLMGGSSVDGFDRVRQTKKPLIAAVHGYALGGGCEIAMMCDIIYAGENAKFGQPEILIGIIAGAGGTQRLPRFVGKSKAMEMVLTGSQVSAKEAEKMGLVSKVFPVEKLLEETIKVGEKIAGYSQLIAKMCKESINTSYETTLTEGIHFEKQMALGTLATKDRLEGVTAFIEKRAPNFINE